MAGSSEGVVTERTFTSRNNIMNRCRLIWGVGIVTALFVAAVLTVVAGVTAAEGPAPRENGESTAQVEIGKPAPDFELPLLKQEVNEKGEKVGRITDAKVRLSSFRGKKVVCLFTSSYT